MLKGMSKEQMMGLIGDKAKYLGGRANLLSDENIEKLGDSLVSLFKNEDDTQYIKIFLKYDSKDDNWNVVNGKKDMFYPIIDTIMPTGSLDKTYENIKITMCLCKGTNNSIFSPPELNVSNRMFFNLYQPETYFLYESEPFNDSTFITRKYMAKNTFVIFGNFSGSNHFVVSKQGKSYWILEDSKISYPRHPTDKIRKKIASYQRISFVLDIIKNGEEINSESLEKINSNMSLLQKATKKRRRRRRKGKKDLDITKEEKEIFNSISENTKKLSKEKNNS